MIERSRYEILKRDYGDVASWAVWELPGTTPKSFIDVVPNFDDESMQAMLGTGYVLVGLNASSTHGSTAANQGPWKDFHSGYRYGNDFKLRFALMNTELWGSYITDVIKRFPEVDSKKLARVLRDNPTIVEDNIRTLRKELEVLGETHTLVALGAKTYGILQRHFGGEYKVVKVRHFACRGSKEAYREGVLSALGLE